MQELLSKIQDHLKSGGIVMISTYGYSWQYDKPSHADLFFLNSGGELCRKRGKKSDCIKYASIKFYTYKKD